MGTKGTSNVGERQRKGFIMIIIIMERRIHRRCSLLGYVCFILGLFFRLLLSFHFYIYSIVKLQVRYLYYEE